jgi:aryl carrier-like protein
MMQFHHQVEPRDLNRDFIPIGRPLPGVDVMLVNDDRKLCAAGEVGEILIGGSTLSLGYFRDEEATRQAFVEMEKPGTGRTRYYRSGDLGVEIGDGMYRLVGRRDEQAKIRGVRVEPREVEDALTGYPLVAACAVIACGSSANPWLAAYVVPETEYPPAIPDMRAYLRERLPLEMIPAKFVLIKQLPLTDTGKINRSLLPQPEPILESARAEAVAPRNLLETALAEYWCKILGLAQVGVHDHFFDLGGHSLSAMRLINWLRAEQNLELSVRDLLDHPTIAQLAERIEGCIAAENTQNELGEIITARRSTNIAPDYFEPATALVEPEAEPSYTGDFACPNQPSPWFGARVCNLVLFLAEDGDRDSFSKLASLVVELDPAIHIAVVEDKLAWSVALLSRPTLFFSPALLRNRPTLPGRICCGYPLSKSAEYAILAEAGIAVPRWVLLREGEVPDLEGFGSYVVRKPDYGAKGAEVRIVRRGRVRWKRVVTAAAGPSPALLVQEFIYTGLWPVSYRVNTLFGHALYSVRISGNTSRPALRGANDFDARGSGNSVSIVSNVRDSTVEYCNDYEIISLGERAARAFPDLPLLGVDILKDASTGRLFVAEVNALGHNWNFSKEFRDSLRIDPALQFDGLRKAAYVLAEQTQKLASLERNSDR